MSGPQPCARRLQPGPAVARRHTEGRLGLLAGDGPGSLALDRGGAAASMLPAAEPVVHITCRKIRARSPSAHGALTREAQARHRQHTLEGGRDGGVSARFPTGQGSGMANLGHHRDRSDACAIELGSGDLDGSIVDLAPTPGIDDDSLDDRQVESFDKGMPVSAPRPGTLHLREIPGPIDFQARVEDRNRAVIRSWIQSFTEVGSGAGRFGDRSAGVWGLDIPSDGPSGSRAVGGGTSTFTWRADFGLAVVMPADVVVPLWHSLLDSQRCCSQAYLQGPPPQAPSRSSRPTQPSRARQLARIANS